MKLAYRRIAAIAVAALAAGGLSACDTGDADKASTGGILSNDTFVWAVPSADGESVRFDLKWEPSNTKHYAGGFKVCYRDVCGTDDLGMFSREGTVVLAVDDTAVGQAYEAKVDVDVSAAGDDHVTVRGTFREGVAPWND